MNKRTAPTIWAMIIIVVILLYAAAFVIVPVWTVRIVAFTVAGGIICAIVYVLMERYHEIEGGETDDLDQY